MLLFSPLKDFDCLLILELGLFSLFLGASSSSPASGNRGCSSLSLAMPITRVKIPVCKFFVLMAKRSLRNHLVRQRVTCSAVGPHRAFATTNSGTHSNVI